MIKRIVRGFWLFWLYIRRPVKYYNLMGLVRGPDVLSLGVLKHVYSGRVRGVLFPWQLWIPGNCRRFPLLGKDVSMLRQELSGQQQSSRAWLYGSESGGTPIYHYVSHAKDAMATLLTAPLLNRGERQEIVALFLLASRLSGVLQFGVSRPEDLTRDLVAVVASWETRVFREEN
jgi:hypothetical protein